LRKIVAFKQQRLTRGLCKRIRKAITEIQLRLMATAFAKIAISFPRNPSLGFGHRLNDNLRLMDELIKTPAGNGITTGVDDDRGFDEIRG
jgi:hypothetical protein